MLLADVSANVPDAPGKYAFDELGTPNIKNKTVEQTNQETSNLNKFQEEQKIECGTMGNLSRIQKINNNVRQESTECDDINVENVGGENETQTQSSVLQQQQKQQQQQQQQQQNIIPKSPALTNPSTSNKKTSPVQLLCDKNNLLKNISPSVSILTNNITNKNKTSQIKTNQNDKPIVIPGTRVAVRVHAGNTVTPTIINEYGGYNQYNGAQQHTPTHGSIYAQQHLIKVVGFININNLCHDILPLFLNFDIPFL